MDHNTISIAAQLQTRRNRVALEAHTGKAVPLDTSRTIQKTSLWCKLLLLPMMLRQLTLNRLRTGLGHVITDDVSVLWCKFQVTNLIQSNMGTFYDNFFHSHQKLIRKLLPKFLLPPKGKLKICSFYFRIPHCWSTRKMAPSSTSTVQRQKTFNGYHDSCIML